MISREGLNVISFLLLLILIFGLLSFLNILFLVAIFLLLLILILTIIFFRDPEREIGKNIVSPADGRIIRIETLNDPDVGHSFLISIFMSIFDVHINRMPIDGKILEIKRMKGGFFPAYSEKSDKNEKNIILIETGIGKIKVIQIAGAIARRVLCYVKEGEMVKKGEKIGMIRFGSRVDIILPKDKVRIKVKLNDRVRAGADEIAEVDD